MGTSWRSAPAVAPLTRPDPVASQLQAAGHTLPGTPRTRGAGDRGMLLGDRPALLDPDPIARVKSQLTEQHARRTLGHSIGDAELILSADERIDALLVQLFDLMASRGE